MNGLGPFAGSSPLLLIPLLFLTSCQEEASRNEELLAEAYGEEFTRTDLEERIPASLTGKDSLAFSETLINNWVREKVLLHKAEKELRPEEKDIAERVESYRRSLLVHALEKKIVGEKLNSEVSEKEIQDFYEEHRKEFSLKEAVLQVDHVQLQKDSVRYLQRFIQAMQKEDEEAKEELKELCQRHATHCSLDDGNWKPLSRLLAETPLEVVNEEEFLKNRTLVRKDIGEAYFLLRIRDHRMKNDVSPLSLVKERIERMLLNERKSAIVERAHQNALSDARKKKHVRIH